MMNTTTAAPTQSGVGQDGEVLIYRSSAGFILTDAGRQWFINAYDNDVPMTQIEQTLGVGKNVRKRLQNKLNLKTKNKGANKTSNKFVTRTNLKKGELIYSEEANRFIAENMNHMSLVEIAKAFDVHPSTIRYQIRRLGLQRQYERPAPQPPRKVTPELIEYIRLHRSTMTQTELAEKLNVSKSTVQKVIRKYNIEKPKHSKPATAKQPASQQKIDMLTNKERRAMKINKRYYTANDYHVGNELTQKGQDYLLKHYARVGWNRLAREMGCSHQYLNYWLEQLGIEKKQDGPKPRVTRKSTERYRIEVSRGTKMIASFLTDDPERINKYKKVYKNYDINLIKL